MRDVLPREPSTCISRTPAGHGWGIGEDPPGPGGGVVVVIAHPVCPPQSVIVSLTPSVACRSVHVSRISKLDDFGEASTRATHGSAADYLLRRGDKKLRPQRLITTETGSAHSFLRSSSCTREDPRSGQTDKSRFTRIAIRRGCDGMK